MECDKMKKRTKRNKQRLPNNKKVVYPAVSNEQLEEGRRRLQGEGCILCGESATHVSVFVVPPDKAKLLGVPPGKIRQFAFPVCRDCLHRKDTPQRAEDMILNNEMADVPRV